MQSILNDYLSIIMNSTISIFSLLIILKYLEIVNSDYIRNLSTKDIIIYSIKYLIRIGNVLTTIFICTLLGYILIYVDPNYNATLKDILASNTASKNDSIFLTLISILAGFNIGLTIYTSINSIHNFKTYNPNISKSKLSKINNILSNKLWIIELSIIVLMFFIIILCR